MVINAIQTEIGTIKPVYNDAHWFALAYAYLLYGSMKKASDEVGIPYGTACGWKKDKTERWLFFIEKAQEKMMDKTVGSLNSILKKVCAMIEVTLDEGEQRVSKQGEVINVRPPLAALNMVMGTTLDKLHRVQGGGAPRKQPETKGKRDKRHELSELGQPEETIKSQELH